MNNSPGRANNLSPSPIDNIKPVGLEGSNGPSVIKLSRPTQPINFSNDFNNNNKKIPSQSSNNTTTAGNTIDTIPLYSSNSIDLKSSASAFLQNKGTKESTSDHETSKTEDIKNDSVQEPADASMLNQTSFIMHTESGNPQADISISNIPLVAAQSSQTRNREVRKVEAKLQVYKAWTFSLMLAFCCISVLTELYGRPYEEMMQTFIIYLLYHIFENILHSLYSERDLWRRRDDKLNAFNALCNIITIACLYFKMEEKTSTAMTALIPAMISLGSYYCLSTAPYMKKRWNLFFKGCELIQTLAVCAKIDGLLDVSWHNLWYLCLPQLIKSIHSLMYPLFGIFIIIFVKEVPEEYEYLISVENFVGTFWYSQYYLVHVLVFFVLSELSRIYDGVRMTLLPIVVIASLAGCWAVFILMYTFLVFNYLIAYIWVTKFGFFSSSNLFTSSVPVRDEVKRIVNFQVEKKDHYFVMISPSYFRPLESDLKGLDAEKIKKIKKAFSKPFLKNKNRRNLSINIPEKPKSPSKMRMYKDMLDKALISAAAGTMSIRRGGSVRAASAIKIVKLGSDSPTKDKKMFNILNDEAESPEIDKKLSMSFSNIDDVPMVSTARNRTRKDAEDEKLCYMCYDNAPDAIMIKCYHGGVCYQCAIDTIKKKNECPECRSKVNSIAKIDPDPKFSEVYRAKEVTTVVESELP